MKIVTFTSVLALLATQGVAGNQATPNAPSPSLGAIGGVISSFAGGGASSGFGGVGFVGSILSAYGGGIGLGGFGGVVAVGGGANGGAGAIVPTGVVVNGVQQTVDTNTGAILTTDTSGDGIADAP